MPELPDKAIELQVLIREGTSMTNSRISWSGEDSDETVLNHIRAGDTMLYEVLVHRYHRRLRRAARRVLDNDADVDDVLQETHLHAFCAINQFESRSSVGTWLTRIAVHSALTRLRLQARNRELTPSCLEHDPLENVVSIERNPEQQLQDKERIEALRSAVQALPEPYRTTCYLRWFRELSTTELAGLLKISESCIKTRIYRAKRLLYGLLHERWKTVCSGLVSARASSPGSSAV